MIQPTDANSRPTLRDRQSELAREAILEALVDLLETEAADDIAMNDLAERAGVSRRTLYRYFPTRADLLAAAGDWIYARHVKVLSEINGADDIPASFLEVSRQLMHHPRLARFMLNSSAGRSIRASPRHRRDASIAGALGEITNHLDSADAARSSAVIQYLCSSRSWVALQDDAGLELAEAQAAIVWALETLIGDLRVRNEQRGSAGA